MVSCTRLFVNTWTAAHQAPLSIEFSRQESWRFTQIWMIGWNIKCCFFCLILPTHLTHYVLTFDCILSFFFFYFVEPQYFPHTVNVMWASQVVLVVKNQPTMQQMQKKCVRSLSQEDSPGGGNGNPCQYSCLENPMDKRVWWATVHTVTKNWTPLKWLSTDICINDIELKSRSKVSLSYFLWNPDYNLQRNMCCCGVFCFAVIILRNWCIHWYLHSENWFYINYLNWKNSALSFGNMSSVGWGFSSTVWSWAVLSPVGWVFLAASL